jgi:hypothetical protein
MRETSGLCKDCESRGRASNTGRDIYCASRYVTKIHSTHIMLSFNFLSITFIFKNIHINAVAQSVYRLATILGMVKNFHFSISSRPTVGPTHLPVKWVTTRVKRQENVLFLNERQDDA